MSALANTLDEVRKRIYLDCPPSWKKYVELVEEKTKINVEYIVLGLGLLLAVLVFAGVGAGFISTLVGVVYPTYATLVTLERGNKQNQNTWLVYWLIFAAVNILEKFLATLISRVPLYYPVKITALLWCMQNGSDWVYIHVIRSFVQSQASPVDAALNSSDPKVVVGAINKEKEG